LFVYIILHKSVSTTPKDAQEALVIRLI